MQHSYRDQRLCNTAAGISDCATQIQGSAIVQHSCRDQRLCNTAAGISDCATQLQGSAIVQHSCRDQRLCNTAAGISDCATQLQRSSQYVIPSRRRYHVSMSDHVAAWFLSSRSHPVDIQQDMFRRRNIFVGALWRDMEPRNLLSTPC